MSKYVIILTIAILGPLGMSQKDYADEDCFLSSWLLSESDQQVFEASNI